MPPHFLLLLDDDRELGVGNAGVELAAHEGGALVVLDVAHVFGLGNLDVLGKTLEMGWRRFRVLIGTNGTETPSKNLLWTLKCSKEKKIPLQSVNDSAALLQQNQEETTAIGPTKPHRKTRK